MMRVHFIAIGGAAMHNLALALHSKGYVVSGSDDEVFEPSKTRLENVGLLPDTMGWFPDKISPKIDAIILGMHARKDNPELLEAQRQGLKIFSYPEYLYEQSKDKTRVVIAGSHGKTTITSMVMHVLSKLKVDFDYMVGSQIEGFDTMVRLSHTAKYIILEGDEYLSSPIDLRSKFLWYKPHVALLSGIAWDHINVFPTWDSYLETFEKFIGSIVDGGYLTYFAGDKAISDMVSKHTQRIQVIPYQTHVHTVENAISTLSTDFGPVNLKVFGDHNLQNLSGALNLCKQIGISDKDFYFAISDFGGAAKRLQTIAQNNESIAYLDFAHSPSKLEATTKAVKVQFHDRQLVACMELHTFSSLKKEFLPLYQNTMDAADIAFVYFNPHTLEHKKLETISAAQVQAAFGGKVKVYTDSEALIKELSAIKYEKTNLLLMTSGNFDGVDLKAFAKQLIPEK